MKNFFTVFILFFTYNVFSQDTLYIENSMWIGELKKGKRDGLWKEFQHMDYFGDYVCVSEGYFKNDIENGLWKFFGISHHGEMELRAEGRFIDGKKEGPWIHNGGYYYCKGKYHNGLKQETWLCFDREVDDSLVHTKEFYIDGIPEGVWELYHEDGTLKATGLMSKGQMAGIWCTSGCIGQLKINPDTVILNPHLSGLVYQIEQECADNEQKTCKTGEWKYFFYDTILSCIGTYVDGKKTGEWKFYHNNGILEYVGKYKNGKKEGVWNEYYENGNLRCKEIYKDGLLNDSCSFYTENGDLLITGQYTNGYRSGEWKCYSVDSIILVTGYYDGLPDDPQPDRPSNGFRCGLEKSKYEIESILNQKNSYYLPVSNRHGVWEEYDSKGVLKERGSYIHGKKNGQWESYYNGFLTSMYNFTNGLRDGEFVEFNWHWAYIWKKGEYKNGKIITQQEFKEAEGLTKKEYFMKKGLHDIPK